MFHQIFILMTFVVISFDIEANVEFGYDRGEFGGNGIFFLVFIT